MTSDPQAAGPGAPAEVLVVGAGPTGLTLAAQLAAGGVPPRVIDRSADRVAESRALAIQPRSLEVLAALGVTDTLVACGNPAVRLRLHAPHRVVSLPLFDLGLDDTAYPYLLFLSQAETERVLQEHLTAAGVTVERRVELVKLDNIRGAGAVTATLRHPDGREELTSARYVVGCDGAHSTVRQQAGIQFTGGSYPQTFVLADTEADGLEPGAAHAFLSEAGVLLFFPLLRPASWRSLAVRPPADPTPPQAPVELDEVQALADAYTGATVRLHDPVWMTNFQLHHRAAVHYRSGRVFLAGDAAHIHSPAGGQGMNTGIQDAVNLGWKLAHTLHGANPALLDTYEPERAPVGARVLRFTDRAFTVATSTNRVVRFARTRLAPALLPLAFRLRAGRAYAFRTISQLGIRYRRSRLSAAGRRPSRRGLRPGDRLPDAVLARDGDPTTLHAAVAGPGWQLLLCGPAGSWDTDRVARLRQEHGARLTVQHLSAWRAPGVLFDPSGRALRRLGLHPQSTAQYLIRPDGHVGYCATGTDLAGLTGYLHRWLPAPADADRAT